ncbi:helix-turn-helix domain-containing protein [Enterococcus faecalis]|uniref:LexA family protein n=1 Tax=Enterococcus faecalis TaxID=1351 RepID=UPI00051E11F2|nr:XRE family transcriptional regulator [Enterococcus faecalis]ELS0476272.1 helix-turn-helix domain-containing protein [Enterococcus faecalis]KGJ37201.1 XRE family transcriptional regulator [Enterococcus faecalis]MCD5247728.1 helix-turn-helix domain-containing protein [Enterococcus faecalis]MDP4430214.1 XRE family transcriptional regulator [Enterococcus faecalis]PQW14394.1 helix-turn-helix domain-containing protein [Enterococcus faecalis]
MKNLQTAKKQREILAKNLESLLRLKGKSQADVIRETGIPEATVRSWFNGEKYPRIDKIQLLSDYFNVPRSRITEEQDDKLSRISSLVKIPILGTITCGQPILAEENLEGYREEIGDLLPTGQLFYLKTKGDSMLPTIPENSYVLIRKQEHVEDGEIAAVRVNGDEEATLKRIKHQGDITMLVADNTNYPPYIITKENPATIIGKAIKVSFDL